MAQTAKLSVALQEVSRLIIADSKGVRSRTTSLSENSYVKALARLLRMVSFEPVTAIESSSAHKFLR